MAVSIDNVYQKVLALANKEQRGYITPQEFNLLADKAQNDIFEMYFHEYKTSLLSPGNQSKTAGDIDMLREKISIHRVVGGSIAIDGTLAGGSGIHWLESVYKASTDATRTLTFTPHGGSGIASSPSASTDVTQLRLRGSYPAGYGNDAITTWTVYLYHNDVTVHSNIATNVDHGVVLSVNPGATAAAVAGVITNTINNTSPFHTATLNTTTNEITITYKSEFPSTLSAEDCHNWVGSDPTVTISTTDAETMAVYEEVDRDDWIYVTGTSKLKPSSSRPVYYRKTPESVGLYPTPSTTISCDYIEKPTKPKWTYVVINDKALYNAGASDKQDFELHASEESTLTNKILELAGIVINKPGLSEVILRNEAIKEANENK
jgi:hypothetical protein